jgi:hypothetical protein
MTNFVVKVSDLTLARTEVVEVLHVSASLTSTQDSFFFGFCQILVSWVKIVSQIREKKQIPVVYASFAKSLSIRVLTFVDNKFVLLMETHDHDDWPSDHINATTGQLSLKRSISLQYITLQIQHVLTGCSLFTFCHSTGFSRTGNLVIQNLWEIRELTMLRLI